MKSCLNCSCKDKKELITDYLNNITKRSACPESYIKEIEYILIKKILCFFL